MAYKHTNSKGQDYFLHSKEVTLRNGRQQRIYYFAKSPKASDALESVPAGYTVSENTATGLPILKKA